MQIREVMTPDPATCEPSTRVRVAADLMAVHDCAAIPVTRGGLLVGIVTDRDIACRAAAREESPATIAVGEVMSRTVIAVHPEDPLDAAVELMEENAIHHLPVIDGRGTLVGILAQSDLGRRMTNREFGRLARHTSIRRRGTLSATAAVVVVRREH